MLASDDAVALFSARTTCFGGRSASSDHITPVMLQFANIDKVKISFICNTVFGWCLAVSQITI